MDPFAMGLVFGFMLWSVYGDRITRAWKRRNRS